MGERAWALGLLAASGAYLTVALGFPFGSVVKPGPGFFPVGVGVFLCLAAGAFVVTRDRVRPGAAARVSPEARARVVVTVLGLVGFCLLLPSLGYAVCAFLFVGLLLRRLGGQGWASTGIVAALSAAVSHYVFAVVLGVPLPSGPF